MKLNGKSNVITDVDITLTGTHHIGESLASVIEETDSRMDKLESNVKWIYQNGGVGSGGSGGGGGSTKWYIRATLGGVAIDSNQEVPLTKGAGSYQLRLWTTGGSGTYNVTYTVGNSASQIVVLSAENGWSTVVTVTLEENGIIEIIATDGTISREITGVSYIVIPYVFNAPILYRTSDDQPYSSANNDIFVETARENGIALRSSYVIASAGDFTYSWYLNGILKQGPTEIIEKSGTLEYIIDPSLFVNENAGLYSYQLVVTVLVPGSTEPVEIIKSGAFNLIPDDLYLKISPANSDEIIYDSQDIDNPYVFATNTNIAINARIYKGITASGLPGTISWIVNGDESYSGNGSLKVTDGLTYIISTHFDAAGWNYITFRYELNGVRGEDIVKYFYCQEVKTSYDWFFRSQNSANLPDTRRYFIGQAITSYEDKVYGIIGVSPTEWYIEKKKSEDVPTSLQIIQTVDNKSYISGDQLLNFGIQYNEINNVAEPLIICKDSIGNDAIKIYQNKVIFGGQFSSSELECNIFLHKESDYDVTDRTKYHLLSINCATCYYADNNSYYELSVYLDGKLEGTVSTKPFASATISSVELQNINFALNHFELSSWGSITSRRVFDIDINWYFNSYSSRLGNVISNEETLILTSLFDTTDSIAKPNYSIENQLLRVSAGLPGTIATNSTIPVLSLTCSRDISYNGELHTIYEWMNTSWKDGEESLNKASFDISKLEWSPGGEGSSLNEINKPIDSEERVLGDFILNLQGSSTMTYKSKNFTLGIRSNEIVTSQNKEVLFSPNFKSNDTSSFLPEKRFTLKADVVDSSHSNNTAVGKFVNENNDWGYRSMIDLTGVKTNIRDHIKQCLEGFATLVFLNVTWKDQEIDYVACYYLGIYNFNLGRDSYFNLGYSDLSQLDDQELDESARNNKGFAYCTANVTPVRGFVATEVQDNSIYWDFSQYDKSILFPLPNSDETSGYMFGDFVYAPNTEGVEDSIRNFVRSVAAGGGFLFDLIGKRKVPCNTLVDSKQKAYHAYDLETDPVTGNKKVYTYVNDYSRQYTRRREGSDVIYTETEGDLHDLTAAYLEDCIIGEPAENKNPKLDYKSIVYYYVTCMVLGLVDSVQKNLNIKTWNASDAYPKMGAFFYDMDTCLGKSNSGNKTSYFAFSDYWKSNIERYDIAGNLIPDDDTTTEAVRIVNKGITNFRDTFLWGSNVTGYDTPGSYLFAIAKYAYLMSFVREAFPETFPQNIYAKWRQATGVLSSADNFIDNYFAYNLSGISGCLVNLNYRNKYLYDYEQQASFAMANVLHGTGVEETRDWLKGRLRIMDAYFNIVKASIHINDIYYEPVPTYTVSTNPDVNLYKDIFTNDVTTYVSRKEALSFNVTAPDYSPLIVRYGNDYIWYIFEDSNTTYETYVPITGVQVTVFGGSQMWRSLDSINSFVVSRDSTSSNFIFNTDILTSMKGTTGTQTGNWEISGPSLETISLTSSNYAGTLSIGRDFYSIKSIDISTSKISLVITEPTAIKTINASNLKNADRFTVSNCKEITDINLNNSIIGECTITPTWTDSLNFSSVYTKKLVLEAKNEGSLTINNNATINSLSFSKIKNVSIDNCSALTSVICTDTDSAVLKKVSITRCPSLKVLTLKADNLEVLNLTNCTSLEEITLLGNSFENLRILGLANTKVSKMTIGSTVCTNGIFDFRSFKKLAKVDNNYSETPYVSFYGNKEVVSVQFDNSGDTILYSDPNFGNLHSGYGAFRECSNLERIYGSFLIQTPSCFYNSNKFSVHGANLTEVTWNGQNVLTSGRCRHPKEWGVSTSTAYWPRNINGITNMKFDGNWADNAFYYTNCTMFDIYYMLYGCDSRVYSLVNTFRQLTNTTWGYFNWNASVDNSPNVNLFANCGSVENISSLFYGNSGTIRFYSPSHNGNTITANNGLFSPLVSLKIMRWTFASYTIYLDRFVLRRTSGTYEITNLENFRGQYILDDVNSYSYNNIPSYNIDYYGNLTGFFTNLTKLSGEVNGLFNSSAFINFSTISNIPDAVTTLRSCFNSTYGNGEISLSQYFSNTTKLQYLYQSFTTTAEFNGYAPSMSLTNATFSRFVPRTGYTGLIEVGYSNSNTNFPVSGPLKSCFSGVIRKSFGSAFPFNIFRSLTNLKMAAGIFLNATGEVENLELPGNLFEKNTQLTNCAALFYNLDNQYTLTKPYDITYNLTGSAPVAVITKTEGSPNFIYCPNLTNVSYLFGSDSSDKIPSLHGQIPRNLFWHGLNESTTRTNTITGTNTAPTPIIDDETGDIIDYTYTDVETVKQYIISPRATISSMDYCFQHCNCEAYEEMELPYEPNPDYNPFDYITTDGETFYQNLKKDTRKYTSAWFYDGRTHYSEIVNNSEGVIMLDFVDWNEKYGNNEDRYNVDTSDWLEISEGEYEDVKPQVRQQYICAPDLLRYCTSSVTISNLFAYSGCIGINTRYYINQSLWDRGGKYAFGILGRICPYLLKSVPNVTSVANMFVACKRLSYVVDNLSQNDYMLPIDFFSYAKNVTNLQNLFKATVQPSKIYLNECFSVLARNNLDVQYAFANCYWQGTEEKPTIISNVFSTNNIDKLVGAFMMEGDTTQNAYPKGQYLKFENVFNSKYASNTYASNMNFSRAFYGWNSGTVTHELPKTLPDTNDTKNYTYIDN